MYQWKEKVQDNMYHKFCGDRPHTIVEIRSNRMRRLVQKVELKLMFA